MSKPWSPMPSPGLLSLMHSCSQQGGGLEPQLSYKWEPTLFEWLGRKHAEEPTRALGPSGWSSPAAISAVPAAVPYGSVLGLKQGCPRPNSPLSSLGHFSGLSNTENGESQPWAVSYRVKQGNDLCLSASHPPLCPLPLYSPWAFCWELSPLRVHLPTGGGHCRPWAAPGPLLSHTACRPVSSMLSEPPEAYILRALG